ncbi:MAG: divalent-cation tolerance protein CutA [Deltaproteobacteria bacterium]|nr:divalent-cation tolerance protein CutA [Deltaproteobacteria bacterium]MBW2159332.1 divalent-cation tolerance protein CutA [Deltaproteobacteria bacterium]MBW2585534.1 divalent-cation tolerance protein CutA [Deltaproteobacteria bacterium]
MRPVNHLVVILCTVPDEATAEKLATGLVEGRLAACVNAVPGVKSFYRWQGKIEAETEIQLLIKTHSERFDELAAWISENHPYEVPEIIAIPADRVSDAYLAWAVEQTS